jgi:hypothetical protein
MRCPSDSTEMRKAEQEGIEIDYCPQCRGVWLDRGELEKIVDRAMMEMEGPDGPGGPGSYRGGPGGYGGDRPGDYHGGPAGPDPYGRGGYRGEGPPMEGGGRYGGGGDGPYQGSPDGSGGPWDDRGGPGGDMRGGPGDERYDGAPQGERRRDLRHFQYLAVGQSGDTSSPSRCRRIADSLEHWARSGRSFEGEALRCDAKLLQPLPRLQSALLLPSYLQPFPEMWLGGLTSPEANRTIPLPSRSLNAERASWRASLGPEDHPALFFVNSLRSFRSPGAW